MRLHTELALLAREREKAKETYKSRHSFCRAKARERRGMICACFGCGGLVKSCQQVIRVG